MFSFDQARRRRKPSLTPMIDVVFLLLVFFMLASRFGTDMHWPLSVGGEGGAAYKGAPRLVDVGPEDLSLNGRSLSEDQLLTELERLTESEDDTIVLRGKEVTQLQRLIEVMDVLGAAGFTRLVLLE